MTHSLSDLPRVCGLPNFFYPEEVQYKWWSKNCETRIKLCRRVNTDEVRGSKLCFILSKIWVPLTTSPYIIFFKVCSVFLENMFEIALEYIDCNYAFSTKINLYVLCPFLAFLNSALFNHFNLQCTSCMCSSLEYRFDVCFKQNWTCFFAMSLQCHLNMIIFRKENTFVC